MTILHVITAAACMILIGITAVRITRAGRHALWRALVEHGARFSLGSLILLVAFVGSGYGLWARWAPWVIRDNVRVPPNASRLGFREGSSQIWITTAGPIGGTPHASSREHPHVLRNGKWEGSEVSWESASYSDRGTLSPDGTRAVRAHRFNGPSSPRPGYTLDALMIFDARNGELLAQLTAGPYWLRAAAFSDDNRMLITGTVDDMSTASASDWHLIEIWHRRRPEYWWGVAWLPEFWLTLVLAGSLIYSVRRDRAMRAAATAA